MRLVNYCGDFDKVVSSGRFYSERCGHVFAVNEDDFRFAWTTRGSHRNPKDTGRIVFIGQAATLFCQHRIEGPWTGAKWFFGQYTTAGGYLEWTPVHATDGVLTVSRAWLVPGRGLAPWKLWFQRLFCDMWIGFFFLPFYIMGMLGFDPPLILQCCGEGCSIPVGLLGMIATMYPFNRVGMIRRPSYLT